MDTEDIGTEPKAGILQPSFVEEDLNPEPIYTLEQDHGLKELHDDTERKLVGRKPIERFRGALLKTLQNRIQVECPESSCGREQYVSESIGNSPRSKKTPQSIPL